MANIVETLANGRALYIPIATNSQKGIASFYESHFDVIDGQVRVKQSYFASLLDEYYSSELNKLKISSSYTDYDLTYKLINRDNNIISTSVVTLPFANYAKSIKASKIGNEATISLMHDDVELSSQILNFSDYANKIAASLADNVLTLDLLNGDISLSKTIATLDAYGTSVSASLLNNIVSVKLLNGTKQLSLSEFTLAGYANAIKLVRNGTALTLQLLNGNTVLSSDVITLPEVNNDDNSGTTIAGDIELSLDPNTYVMTAYLKDVSGNIISQDSVDLPLETVVVNGDEKDGIITLTLQNGETITFEIGDLVDGLVSQAGHDADIAAVNEKIDTMFANYVTDAHTLIGEVEITTGEGV